jgi:hypothetical protein
MRRKKVVYATPTNETREKVLNQIANVKKTKQKNNGNVRHRRRMEERIKFKTHLTFLSLCPK